MDSLALRILKVMKPARKVVTRSPHREVGYLAGASVGEAEVEHESHLEKSFAVLAVVSSVVRGLESQPFKIIWTDPNGSEHLYTPDYRVTLTDGTEVIVELKPARRRRFSCRLTHAAQFHKMLRPHREVELDSLAMSSTA